MENNQNKKEDYREHRKRVRKRIREAGVDSLADYELLEALLFYAHQQKDTKPIAKDLLREFGSIGKAFHAERHQLTEVQQFGPTCADLFELVRCLTQKIAKEEITKKDETILSSWQSVTDYCRSKIGFSGREKFAALLLDSKNRLIADKILSEGTVNKVTAYPSQVVRFALLSKDAAAVILVHNHPSGDTTPSKQDIEMTRNIAQALNGAGIALHDHLIVGANDATSFKNLGLLD